MNISERDITKAELDAIYRDFRNIEIKDGIPQRKTERFEYIAEENDRVIGYVSGITEHKWFYLTDLWVEESRRRKGLGTKLLCMIEQKALSVGMEHIYLWTAGSINSQFYEKNGYERFTVFENKYEVEGYHQFGYRKNLLTGGIR
ncbi:MAG: GNAT family N-acetyltransferase [Ruminococcus sp.]|nr:GNAT family N-acetyltransferase [Ruminococcus sp.]